MEKKEYKEPKCVVVELDHVNILAESGDENPDHIRGNYHDQYNSKKNTGMKQTDKKEYCKPDIRIVELEASALLAESDEFPGYDGPLG